MKGQLQQIQAVAIVTFLCVLISVHSDGDYGKWFVVDGVREDITYADVTDSNGNVTTVTTESDDYNFEYSYYLNYYEHYNSADLTINSVSYASADCQDCTNQDEAAGNIKILAYGTALIALSVAYMANNSVKNLHNKNLRSSLSNLKYVAIIVLIFGLLTGFLFYTTWPEALIMDEGMISIEQEGVNPRLGCIVEGQAPNEFNFYNKGNCEEYIPAPGSGDSDLISARLTSIEWRPGIGFFIVLIGSTLTGGGTLYILGNIDDGPPDMDNQDSNLLNQDTADSPESAGTGSDVGVAEIVRAGDIVRGETETEPPETENSEVEESSMEKLEKLIERRNAGEITSGEFEEMKKKILERKPQTSREPDDVAQEEADVSRKDKDGAGSFKMQELRDLTGMKDRGLIDDAEFKQIKKEILGK